jgi:hypothetical protein
MNTIGIVAVAALAAPLVTASVTITAARGRTRSAAARAGARTGLPRSGTRSQRCGPRQSRSHANRCGMPRPVRRNPLPPCFRDSRHRHVRLLCKRLCQRSCRYRHATETGEKFTSPKCDVPLHPEENHLNSGENTTRTDLRVRPNPLKNSHSFSGLDVYRICSTHTSCSETSKSTLYGN